MAETHTTEQVDTAGQQVRPGAPLTGDFAEFCRIRDYIHQTSPDSSVWMLTSDILRLQAALAAFAGNRARLTSDDPADQEIIHKHAAFTMLVPGGKAAKARLAVDRLFQTGFPYLAEYTGRDIADISGIIKPYVRFHNTKATRLAILWAELPELGAKLAAMTVHECRDYLVKNIPGFGRKAAAHFMRNVGLSSGADALPIIDVHIRKLFPELGDDAPYADFEHAFTRLAGMLGVSVHLLDACVWCSYANNWKNENADFDNFTVGTQAT